MVMDSAGNERWRLEGYLPKNDFEAFLELGLARVAFMKKDWVTAEQHFSRVADSGSIYAAEGVYYAGVSRYSHSHDHTVLGRNGPGAQRPF
jgi:hypothetical protein